MSTVISPLVSPTATRSPSIVRRTVQSTWVAAGAAAVLLAFVWGQTFGTPALTYQQSALQNLGNVLAPLMAIALFVERAVEVVISSWRNQGAMYLKSAVESASEAVSKAAAEHALAAYRDATQTLAFITGLSFSAIAAMVGVRAIAPLVVVNRPMDGVFYAFDVAITALLLAGGADGLHQIVTTFTEFLDSTKAKMAPTTAAPAASTAPTTTTTTTTETVTPAPAIDPAVPSGTP